MAVWKKSVTGEGMGTPPAGWQAVLAKLFGTGLGTGYARAGQGTLGSALFVLLWIVLVPEQIVWQWAVVIVLHLVSIPLSGWGERMWGKDPGRITIDEFAGQAIALIAVPKVWPALLAAFLLFRVFDTFKFPFVRRHVETLPGGWGVTLDDTIAGIIARLLMIPVLYFLTV
ncbi:MAG: phosphatidylglycerophosphatase A [bacterium]